MFNFYEEIGNYFWDNPIQTFSIEDFSLKEVNISYCFVSQIRSQQGRLETKGPSVVYLDLKFHHFYKIITFI